MSEPVNWDRCQSWADYHSWSKAYSFAGRSGFELTSLQIEDVHRFLSLERSANFYEVGGGKSAVSSVVALMRGNPKKFVVVPPILITQWANWLSKVSEGVLIYRGTPVQRAKADLSAAHWVVMSHAIFREDFDRLEKTSGAGLELIVDEAHALKCSGSVLFKKVQRLIT